jgi:hypothetical protein
VFHTHTNNSLKFSAKFPSKFNAPGCLSCSMFSFYTLTPCNVCRHKKMATINCFIYKGSEVNDSKHYGPDAQRVYNTFDIVADDREKIDVLKTKFKEYCEPRKNLTYIRHVFFTRNQFLGP